MKNTKFLLISLVCCFQIFAAQDSVIKKLKSSQDPKSSYENTWKNSKEVEAIYMPEEGQLQLNLKRPLNIKEFGYKSYVILKEGLQAAESLQTMFIGIKGEKNVYEIFKDGTIRKIIITKTPIKGDEVSYETVQKRITPVVKK